MRAAAALAILGLAATVATSTHAAERAVCGPPPARPDAAHGFELDVVHAQGYVVDATGRFGALIPGVHVDRFSGGASALQRLVIDAGGDDAYTVWMTGKSGWPARFVLRRGTAAGTDAVAAWFVPRSIAGAKLELGFASGEPLAATRLCIGTTSLAPTVTATGGAAADTTPPHLAFTVTGTRVTLHAVGAAAVWYAAPNAVRYTRPFTVARGTKVRAWAIDRAGNEAARAFVVR